MKQQSNNIDESTVLTNAAIFDSSGKLGIKDGVNQFFKTEASFIFLLLYIFIEYVSPQHVYPQINFLPWAQLFFLGAFGFFVLEKKKFQLHGPFPFVVISFCIWCFLSSIFSAFPSRSFEYYKIIINWTLLYILFASIVTTKEKFLLFFCAYLLFNFKMSQHASISWAQRGFSFERWGIAGTPGWFGNAADLGLEMIIFLPLGFAFFLAFRQKLPKFLKIITFLFPVTALMALIATGQRGPLLGLGVAMFYLWYKSKSKVKSGLAIALAAIVFINVMPAAFLARFDNIGSDETSNSRLKYWKRGVEMFADNPVLGIGYENWIPYYQREYPGESLRGPIQEVAHSTPVTVLAELGSVGFFLYYLMAYLIISTANKIRKKAPGTANATIALALSFGTIGYMISSAFITVAYYPFLWVQVCMVSALANISGVYEKPKRKRV
ncbi:O-antigen ligase [Reinekea sp. G2M2-21]|uniref:O-antigen ligase family protein n=1 Tax=Reinekea sp. G2M2-21 TaxID=2788942 RepID=UPI0018A8F567|nr:O-antigen ligase family protein [Reinekea sp. G2M2-21]